MVSGPALPSLPGLDPRWSRYVTVPGDGVQPAEGLGLRLHRGGREADGGRAEVLVADIVAAIGE